MRVLLLVDSFEENAARSILYRLCQRWAPMRELNLAVLGFGPEGPMTDMFGALGIATIAAPNAARGNFRAIRELGRKHLYRADRPDLVHSHCGWPDLNARVFHGGHENVPLLTTIYDNRRYRDASLLARAVYFGAEKFTRQRCAGYVFASECAKKSLVSFNLPQEKTHLVQPGADAVQIYPLSGRNQERFRALVGVANDAPLLFSCSRLVEGEGHADLIDAMPAILARHPAAVLLISGDGPLRNDLERRALDLGVEGSVKIVGRLSELTTKLYSTADLVLHPVRVDRCAIQVPEAQAAGTPIVAADEGSIRELMRDGETGVLFEPGNVVEIARVVDELLSDPARRFEMGAAARAFAMEYLELGRATDAYLQIWRDLAPEAVWKSSDSIPLDALEGELESANR